MGKLEFTDENDPDGKTKKKKKKVKLNLLVHNKVINKLRTVNKKEEGRDTLIDKCKIKVNYEVVKIEAPVFVHFEFDEFKAWWIPLNKDTEEFSAEFMMPPGKWKMFFTTQLTYAACSTAYPKIPTPKTIYKYTFDKNNPDKTTYEIPVTD